jgi:hypothetical protein
MRPILTDMLNRTAWIAIAAAALVSLVVGLGIGAVAFSSDSTTEASDASTNSTNGADASSDPSTPGVDDQNAKYGSDEDRQALVDAAEDANITGIYSDADVLLAAADKGCYDLERLTAQGRSPAYATTVVWNESLAELDSEDLAGFATVFTLAPVYLCPENAGYAQDVAYILGF